MRSRACRKIHRNYSISRRSPQRGFRREATMFPEYKDVIAHARVVGLRVLTGAAILLAFWIAGHIAGRIVSGVSRTSFINPDLLHLLGRTAKTALIVLG